MSGTSAGAINAAIVARRHRQRRAAKARERCAHSGSRSRQPQWPISREVWGPVERHWRETIGMWLIPNGTLSPYHANPLGVNPLREANRRARRHRGVAQARLRRPCMSR